MNPFKDKPTAIAALVAVALGAGGYFGLISPQQTDKADLADQLRSQQETNERLKAQLPTLKDRLQGITGQVDALRELSARVPPQIDQGTLYQQLRDLGAQAGVEELTNISVSVPQMVQTPTAPAAPAQDDLDAELDAELTDGTDPAEQPADPGQAPTASGPVLAYYDVSMSVRGTSDQIVAFLAALRDAPRISIVSSSSLSGDAESSTLNISARMFLQQVDVDGLAAQIEQLAESAKDGTGAAQEQDASTTEPTVAVESETSPEVTGDEG